MPPSDIGGGDSGDSAVNIAVNMGRSNNGGSIGSAAVSNGKRLARPRAQSLLHELHAGEEAAADASGRRRGTSIPAVDASGGGAAGAAGGNSPNHSSSGDSGHYAFDILSNIGIDLTQRDIMSDLPGPARGPAVSVQSSNQPLFPMLEPLPVYVGAEAHGGPPTGAHIITRNTLPHQSLSNLHPPVTLPLPPTAPYGFDSMSMASHMRHPAGTHFPTSMHGSAMGHASDYAESGDVRDRFHASSADGFNPMTSSSRSAYSPAAKKRKGGHVVAPSPSPSSTGGGDDEDEAPMSWSINEHEATARIFDARMSEMYVSVACACRGFWFCFALPHTFTSSHLPAPLRL